MQLKGRLLATAVMFRKTFLPLALRERAVNHEQPRLSNPLTGMRENRQS